MLNRIVVSHPTGNANVRAIANGFKRAGMLEKFVTCIAYFEDSLLLKTNLKNAERRRFDGVEKADVITYPWKEAGRLLSMQFGLDFLTASESSIFNITNVYQSLDKFLSRKLASFKNADAVYSYEDGAYSTFNAAKQRGLTCIYDLPIAYWQKTRMLLLEEAVRYPQWKGTLSGGISDSQEKLQRKTSELELADVVTVPSMFVASSLPEWAKDKKVIISPFGTPAAPEHFIARPTTANRPLRVLFAGSMSQRKGLADLFEAIKLLNTKAVELVVLGSPVEDISFYKKAFPGLIYEPPRPHAAVLELMETCDIFCLPSIIEGRALVMQEAMSRHLPVIITKNTGGEDLIKEGETGFLVPTGQPEIIAERISWFLENRQQIKDMGDAAAAHAATYTWQQYSNIIIQELKAMPG